MSSSRADATYATTRSSQIGFSDACSLYVHLPWCTRKCPYCDFNSYERPDTLPEQGYVQALLSDLQFEVQQTDAAAINSIYMGGGTPSLFSVDAIARLLDGIHSIVGIEDTAEITLEANPGTHEAGRFAGYRAAGVGRLSIGVQSLRDAQLRTLGRVHDADAARRAVAAALEADFDSVNVDVMYGLPGDGVEDSLNDLRALLALGTPHVSWYQLTLEPNTAWERRPPAALPDDDVIVQVEEAGRAMLRDSGLARYEISAYAKPGHRCIHNLHYWHFGDYIGIGAGAHGKRRRAPGIGHVRQSKLRNPRSFIAAAGSERCIESTQTVTEARAVALEFLMNALRLMDGTPTALMMAATGVDAVEFDDALQQARGSGLLETDAERLRVTSAGASRINEILRTLC